MVDRELRLRALELAVATDTGRVFPHGAPDPIVERAKAFEAFLLGESTSRNSAPGRPVDE